MPSRRQIGWRDAAICSMSASVTAVARDVPTTLPFRSVLVTSLYDRGATSSSCFASASRGPRPPAVVEVEHDHLDHDAGVGDPVRPIRAGVCCRSAGCTCDSECRCRVAVKELARTATCRRLRRPGSVDCSVY